MPMLIRCRSVVTSSPAGNPLSRFHPWNEETRPKPGGQNWREKYSWAKSPRWDRRATEAGCYARLWNTAVAQQLPESRHLSSTGSSLRMILPRGVQPEIEIEWRCPTTGPSSAIARAPTASRSTP